VGRRRGRRACDWWGGGGGGRRDATGVAGSPFESTQDKNFVGGEQWFQSDRAMEKEVVIFGCSSGAEQSFTMPPNQTAV